MHIRCPHCHNAIEVVQDSSFRDVECPGCGSHFNLVGSDEVTQTRRRPNRTLAHFELVDHLGTGASGSVWKAKDRNLDRFVALKIPRREQLTEDELEAFLREARAAGQIHHANIVGVHEVGRDDDTLYIVSDYVEGVTLEQWLKSRPVAPREAAQLCLQIADALAHAHEHGVIHRDLKPSNILMDATDKPHITDFGLARREAGEVSITVDGVVLGTLFYMSPEQAKGKSHHADRRSDVYSLGIILYQMLTGDVPFKGEKQMVILQVQTEEPVPPRRLYATISRDLETICLKCLEKSPEKRYQSAADLSAELKRFIAGSPIKARPVGHVSRTWRWAKRNPAVASLSAAVVLALLGGIAGISYWASVAASERQQAVRSLVSVLSTTPPSEVPSAMDAIRPFKDEALPLLRQQYADATGQRKLHTAYGLVACGDVHLDYLVSSVGEATQGECDNLVETLRHQRDSALAKVKDAAATATSNGEWQLKTRLATVALHLGDSLIAANMLRAFPRADEDEWDPIQRTMFIEHFPKWAGSVDKLVKAVKTTHDNPLRSGIVLAIGSITEPTTDAKQAWEPVLGKWHRNETDSGLHSATGWALRSWGLSVPNLEAGHRNGFDWYVTKTGLTMIRIPAGQVERAKGHAGEECKTIRIEQDFWLCDCEVTLGQFTAFLNEDDEGAERPADQDEISRDNQGDPLLPISGVNWYDAVLFCNWLSLQEGRNPCYRKEGKEQIPDHNQLRAFDAWNLVPGTNGYRLPTADQWEYACRVGTTTAYSFGNEKDLLDRYAVYVKNQKFGPGLVAGRLCNAWGLFDMHGNASEWCQDWQTAWDRVILGGSWGTGASSCRSAGLNSGKPSDRGPRPGFLGFRVALVSSSESATWSIEARDGT